MSKRSQAEFEHLWGLSDKRAPWVSNLCSAIRDIVSEFIPVPNGLYYPDDLCVLALGLIPGVWYDTEDITGEMRKRFEVPKSEKHYSTIDHGTMRDLMELLHGHQESPMNLDKSAAH